MPTTWRQDGFRFRNDDGNELIATWIDALNTNISKNITYGSVNVRLRIAASEQGTTAAALTGRLYVSKNGGAYAQVSEVSTNGVKVINSANLTDDEATTQQISSVTWVAGKADDVNGQCSATGSIARYSGTEHEYMLQLDCTHLVNGDYFDFEEYNSTSAFATYTVVGRITISATWLNVVAPLTGDADQHAWAGYTCRMLIPAADISNTGLANVRVAFFAAEDENMYITKAYIGHAAAAGDVYDFETTPTPLLFNGNAYSGVIPMNSYMYSDPVAFSVQAAKNLVVAIFTEAGQTANDGMRQQSGKTGWRAYDKAGDDASTVDATGYNAGAGDVCIGVFRIEAVAAAGATVIPIFMNQYRQRSA